MVSNSVKYGVAGVVVVVAVIAIALAAIPSMKPTQTSQSSSSQSPTGGSGTLSLYLTDAPPSAQTLKYLMVNVTSVDLAYEGSLANTTTASSSVASTNSSSASTTNSTSTSSTSVTPLNTYTYVVPAGKGQNVNLTSLQGKSLLLGTTTMPAGNITRITLNVSGAKAFYTDGSSEQLKVVANGKLMIPIHFSIQANGSADLTIDLTPNLVHISQGGVLTPVLHATAVSRGKTTTTETAEVTASENSTSAAAP